MYVQQRVCVFLVLEILGCLRNTPQKKQPKATSRAHVECRNLASFGGVEGYFSGGEKQKWRCKISWLPELLLHLGKNLTSYRLTSPFFGEQNNKLRWSFCPWLSSVSAIKWLQRCLDFKGRNSLSRKWPGPNTCLKHLPFEATFKTTLLRIRYADCFMRRSLHCPVAPGSVLICI